MSDGSDNDLVLIQQTIIQSEPGQVGLWDMTELIEALWCMCVSKSNYHWLK